MEKFLRISVVFIFVTCCWSIAEAQHLYLGARVGANLANEFYSSLPAGYSKAINGGLLLGGEIHIPLDGTWSLNVEALYDQKGTNQKFDHVVFTTEQSPEPIVASGTSTIDVNYLEFPLYLQMTLGRNAIRPYFFAGPSLGVFLNGSQSLVATSTSNGGTETIVSYQTIQPSSVKSPDISIVVGAGISYSFGSGHILFADGSYAYGFTNLVVPSNAETVKSRDIRLAAGILFPLD